MFFLVPTVRPEARYIAFEHAYGNLWFVRAIYAWTTMIKISNFTNHGCPEGM